MADSKLEMHVSPLPDKITTKFKRQYPCFRSYTFHWVGPMRILCDQTGSGKYKMAASKLEMHVSSLTEKISTHFKQLNLRYRGPAFHWDPRDCHTSKLEVEKSKSEITGKSHNLVWANRSPAGDWGQRWVTWWVGSYSTIAEQLLGAVVERDYYSAYSQGSVEN